MPPEMEPRDQAERYFGRELSDSTRSVRLVRAGAWTVTTVAGLLQALAARYYINEDGSSYLDVASAYLRHDWARAVNGYWSPLYSWLIALVLWLFKPSAYWETTILHLVSLVGLLVSLRAFEFFLRAFLASKHSTAPSAGESLHLPLSVWWILGYGLFIGTMLEVLTMHPTSPDAWVCAVTFLTVGLTLKIWARRGGFAYFAALGAVLGVGYLTKAFYFPMAPVFIGSAWLASRNWRKNLAGAIVAFVAFGIVAGPFVCALSKAKHRLTYGDVGKINYAEFIDQIQQPLFWQGGGDTGTPRHAARLILGRPSVYEFAVPIGGTYPLMYDRSYWQEGMVAHFSFNNQLKIFRQSAGTVFLILLAQLEYTVGLLALVLCNRRAREWVEAMCRQWFVWVPAAAACLGFTSVLIEGRYVASFLVILWVAAFESGMGGVPAVLKRAAVAILLAAVLVTGAKTTKMAVSDAFAIPHQENANWAAARALGDLGVRRGDWVAIFPDSNGPEWARIAGVRIVAELPLGQDTAFWAGDTAVQKSVLTALVTAGAKFVVAKSPPACAVSEGWTLLGDTDYYARSLAPDH